VPREPLICGGSTSRQMTKLALERNA
jgi:hypothetical protein